MFTIVFDPVDVIAIGLFSGRENSDEDFEAYCRSIKDLDKHGIKRERPVYVLVVDPGNPMPNATWRKRIADVSAQLECTKSGSRPLFVMVSSSILARGVVTAITWLRPNQYDVETCGTFIDAVRIVADARGRPSPGMHELLTRVRAAAVRKH